MKVNLECGNDIRSGYLNISSRPYGINTNNLPDHTKFIVGHYNKLDGIVPDESVEELIFNDHLNSLPPNEILPVFDHWKKKLKPKGKLKLSFVDIKRVGRAAHLGEANIQEIAQLIFGPANQFRSIAESSLLKTVLKHIGFDIDYLDVKNYFGTIEATKRDESKN